LIASTLGENGEERTMSKKSTTMPTYDQMMWPALLALKEIGGSASIHELLDKVVQVMGLSEDVQSIPHKEGPGTEVAYRLAWARTYLKKAGALENSGRGVWSITSIGRTISETEVGRIPAAVRKEFTGKKKRPVEVEEVEEETIEETWRDQLLSIVREMPADAFERLAQRILREAGFVKVEVTGKTGDGGIDGVGVLRLQLVSFQVFFQCKRYAATTTVSPSAIRDFRGAMVGRTDKGLFITTGRFTSEAKKEATRDGAPPIELIDGENLCDLLKTLKLGVNTELVERASVEPAFFKGI
jgi:restriction system protein